MNVASNTALVMEKPCLEAGCFPTPSPISGNLVLVIIELAIIRYTMKDVDIINRITHFTILVQLLSCKQVFAFKISKIFAFVQSVLYKTK